MYLLGSKHTLNLKYGTDLRFPLGLKHLMELTRNLTPKHLLNTETLMAAQQHASHRCPRARITRGRSSRTPSET